MKHIFATAAFLALAGSAQAGVVNHADVNGFRTFQDTNTGLVWADLDNWVTPAGTPFSTQFGGTYAGYLTALQSAGFVWAERQVVDNMLQTIDIRNQWAAVQAAMQTDWGNSIEYLGGFSDNGGGTFYVQEVLFNSAGAYWADSTPAGGNPSNYSASRGLWAYLPAAGGGGGANDMPEPTTLTLAVLALAAAGFGRKARAG